MAKRIDFAPAAVWLKAKGPSLVRDTAGVCAAFAVAHGAGMIWPPAGWIVGGVLGVAGAILHALGSKA
jgi:hypothetical protein